MNDKVVAIITGDIVESRKISAAIWLNELKSILREVSDESSTWEIFRGDMFQLEIDPHRSLEVALIIKARIKQIKNLDVRIAIGIGKQEYKTEKITESNGEAYILSGTCFENLKKRRLAIKTPWSDFDKEWNLYLRLLSLTIDRWTPKTSKIIEMALKNRTMPQILLAKILNRTQSTISDSLNRAGHDEIGMLLFEFTSQLNHKMQQP